MALPTLLCGHHLNQLSAADDQNSESARVGITDASRFWLHHFGEMRRRGSVDRVGLGQASTGACELTYMPGIQQSHRYLLREQPLKQ
jgi:hypothetical protein